MVFFLSLRSLVCQGHGWALVPLFFGTGNRIEEETGGFQVFLKDSLELRAIWEVPGRGGYPLPLPRRQQTPSLRLPGRTQWVSICPCPLQVPLQALSSILLCI